MAADIFGTAQKWRSSAPLDTWGGRPHAAGERLVQRGLASYTPFRFYAG